MCIFCEIAKKNIPSRVVYEDDKTLAFLDLSPINEGHTLVIPKKHFDDVFSLDEDTMVAVSKTVLNVTKLLKEKLNVDSINVLNNSGEVAGQTVKHFHVHLIPRKENDPLTIVFDKNITASENLDNTLELLKK